MNHPRQHRPSGATALRDAPAPLFDRAGQVEAPAWSRLVLGSAWAAGRLNMVPETRVKAWVRDRLVRTERVNGQTCVRLDDVAVLAAQGGRP